MSKKNIVKEDSEFRYLEEHFEEMMEEMKKDKLTQDFQISQEWDQKFRKTIDETLEELRKKSRRRKIKNAVIAAGVILAATACVDYSMVAVQGEGLLDIVESVFNSNGKNYVIYGTQEEPFLEQDNEEEVYFDITSLEKAYKEMSEEILYPIFYVSYIPEQYVLQEVKYNKVYKSVNMIFEKEGKHIYISQQLMTDEGSSGMVTDDEKIMDVKNTNLNQKISVYQSNQDNSLVFSVQYKTGILTFNGLLTPHECKKIAETIYYE